jgi:hypothetical protein
MVDKPVSQAPICISHPQKLSSKPSMLTSGPWSSVVDILSVLE